jgi:glycosyltransferase involved in cell wall biosynthesis
MSRLDAISTLPAVAASVEPDRADLLDTYRFGFVLQQVLGWVAMSQNFKRFTDTDPSVRATWTEVTFRRPGGAIERLPLLPDRAKGAMRGALEVRQGLGAASLPAAARLLPSRYDAVLFNSQSLCLGASGYLRRTPTVIVTDVTPRQLEAMDQFYGRIRRRSPLRARLRDRAYHDIFHAARIIAPCSEWVKRSLVEEYDVPEERIMVVPHAVDVREWSPPDRHRSDRLRDGAKPRVLFVGGDFERKGGSHLLEWYLRRGKDLCELHVVTRTPPATDVSGLDVHFHVGLETNDPQIAQLNRDADLFVLPTLADCFGVASIEAMATGLPVITTAVGGVPEIVDDGVQGFIIAPGDDEALAQRTELLLARTDLRLRMGDAARAKALGRFDARDNAKVLLGVMKQIAREGRQRKGA